MKANVKDNTDYLKPQLIRKGEWLAIKDALHKKANKLNEQATIEGRQPEFGSSSFFWYMDNYNHLDKHQKGWHFITTPCDWATKPIGEDCICLARTKGGKYWLHTHKVGECPWRTYEERYI
jgi:hypothetical protein